MTVPDASKGGSAPARRYSWPPFEPGNSAAVTHGAHSEQRLAPLRAELAASLRRDYPHLDDRRLALIADRLARLQSAWSWLDEQAGVVRNEKGEPYPIVDRVDKWAGVAWSILLEGERREHLRGQSLDEYLHERYGGDEESES